MIRAADVKAVCLLRTRVPEFEQTFRRELAEEDGDLGPFQAVSIFASWTLALAANNREAEPVRRAFAAIEELAISELQLGDALVAEFIEATSHDGAARQLMGPLTLQRAGAGT